MLRHWLPAAILMASSAQVLAQTNSAPAATASAVPGQPVISAKNGQSSGQLDRDRYECHTWATSQSGFDPSISTRQGSPPGADGYNRAFAACMDGRGYDVHFSAPAAVASTPPPPVTPYRATTSYVYEPGPELKYHPFEFAIEGGDTVSAGRTGDHLDDGATGGLGLTWFPAAALPLGIRVDASYSRLDVRHHSRAEYGYARGHDNLYGGDADLQFDFLKSGRNKLYVFGGAGEYQEQIRRRETTVAGGTVCDFFGCGPGSGTVETTQDRTTTGWRPAYNAGLGWETAIADHASFFVEARYLRIAPGAQFAPVRVGFRF